MTESLNVFEDIDNLLQVLILAVIEDWIVDDDTINGGVSVRGQDSFFNVITGNFTKRILESTR